MLTIAGDEEIKRQDLIERGYSREQLRHYDAENDFRS